MSQTRLERLEAYLLSFKKDEQKDLDKFKERLETHPVWAFEHSDQAMAAAVAIQQIDRILKGIASFRELSAINVADADAEQLERIAKAEEMIGGGLTEANYMDHFVKEMTKELIKSASNSSRSTSATANMVREALPVFFAKVLDDRMFHWGY